MVEYRFDGVSGVLDTDTTGVTVPPIEGGPVVSVSDRGWMGMGACSNERPGIFYPSTTGADMRLAKRICSRCVVRERCLEYAISNRIDDGIWGGESERARARIARERRLGA